MEKNESGKKSHFDKSKYLFMLESPFEVSNRCCAVMKKAPIKAYNKKTGRKPITAQLASESKQRTQQWLKNGCNGFDMKSPVSNPLAFWTEQDILAYIKTYNVPIASVYGEVIEDGEIDGQMRFDDLSPELGIFDLGVPLLKTTGCDRTGCMFCGYGCHLEKGEGRFERMRRTHPKQYEWIMKPWSEGGLGYRDVISWINEHGDMNIKI